MVQVVKDVVTWLKQWFYTETEVNDLLATKANKNLTTANQNVVTDASGDITTEAKPTIPSVSNVTPSADVNGGSIGSNSKYAKADHQHPLSSAYATATHKHGNLQSDGTITAATGTNASKNVVTASNGKITLEAKPVIPTKTSDLTNDGDDGTNVFVKNNDSRLSDSRTPKSHNQATSTITNSTAFDNIKSGESTTLTLNTQAKINSAINDRIGSLASIRAIEVVDTKPTASADTMGKLYIIAENNKVNVYYTKQTGTIPDYTYSWQKMDADILDELTISWNDVTGKPTFATVATSGSYNDLTNKPTIPSVTDKADKTSALGTTITLVNDGETNAGCIIFNTIS